MKKIYKKIILCIVGIVLLIAIASRFASLDEKISWSNRSYLKIVKVRNVDVDNYKRFTNLESIYFCVKPKNETIKYIKEKFPNCELKYGMVIE